MLVFCDSFDHYATAQLAAKWDTVGPNTNTTINSAAGRNATGGLRTTGVNGAGAQKILAGATATVIVGFACQPVLPTTESMLLLMRDGTPFQVYFSLSLDGRIRAYRGTSASGTTTTGTLLGTSTPITGGAYGYLEFKVLIHATTGTVDIRYNGVSILSLTGQITKNTNAANASVSVIGLAHGGVTITVGLTLPVAADFDDLYICDTAGAVNNDWLGDVRVQAILPTGAGNYAQWTPSASTNVSNVDDAAASIDDDTTYNSSSTVAQKDSFVHADITPTSGAVKAVVINLRARKDDAGTREIRGLARLSGTNGTGATKSLTTSYINYQDIMETDPAAAAWTVSAVNSAEYGYDVVS